MRNGRLYMRGRGLHTEGSLSVLRFWVSLNEEGQVINERKGLIHRGMFVS